MPNRPTHPRIALPPALALRVDALRAGAPTGRPSRQAVVERALAVGLGVLEGAQAAPGAAVGPKPAPTPADAPTGQPAPALARRVAAKARAAGLDAKARAGVVTVRSLTPIEQDLARRYPDWNPSDGENPGPGTLHRLQAGTEDDPRLRAWKAEAEAFLSALNPRDFGRAAPLHAVWEPLAPDGALCFDVCDGTGTTGGAVGLDWQTAWGESDESTIRNWLGEAERRPWDMGPACDGCRGLAGDAPAPALPIYLTTPATAPWAVEVGQATVTSIEPTTAPTAEDEAAAAAVNRGRPDGRVRTRVVG